MTLTLQGFETYEDVANRALQHCGIASITTLGPGGDDTKSNQEVSGCFHKLRLAELRRNTWRFAIRKAVLYPVSTTMMSFVPSAYAGGTTYAAGAIVLSGSQVWSSKVNGNIGNTPGAEASVDAFGHAVWEPYFGPLVVDVFNPNPTNLVPAPSPPAYYAGDLVYLSNTAYRSLCSSNTDTPPTAQWLTLSGTLTPFSLLYPISAGPSEQAQTRNVYMLPNGFLRSAPQDPRAGSTSYLGTPSNLQYTDWEFENNYFVTRNSEPIVFRFTADVQDVTLMDDNFCEGWAARVALEVCEPLTQSTTKLRDIGADYQRFMSEARILNALEIGPVEAPADDYITCRI